MGRLSKKLAKFAVCAALTAVSAVAAAFSVSAYDANTKLLKQYEKTKVSGSVNAAISGSYIDDITNAINRVNAIRKEACDEGVWDPRNSSRKLTPSDYVPIKWSNEMEEDARLRAAEAAINIDHTRPNGESCWTVEGSVFANNEVLAWNYNKNMVSGINQFYSEKSSWVNKSGGVTGHYTAMINPNNKYMGLGCFYATSKVSYPNTLCGRFSSSTKTTKQTGAVSNCYVPVQVQSSKLTNASIKRVSGNASLTSGQSASYELWADAKYSTNTNVLLYEATWKSANTAVATVDKYGKVTAVGGGTVSITATCGNISKSVSVTVKEPSSVTNCTITLSSDKLTYTGAQLKPTVTVKNGSATLTNGTDYTVSYKNNINVGTATATITGKGEYTGSVSKTFTIAARSVSGLTYTLEPANCTYNGKAQTPKLTVKYGSTVLATPTSYTATYKNNTEVGTASVVVTGAGNFTGTKTVTFKIYPTYERINGSNRYTTSVAISSKSYTSADTVVIASGDEFADALAGVPLAKAYKAPILLTSANSITSETLSEISRLKAKTAIILGGTGAVSQTVEQKLSAKGLKIDRIAGDTRFETAALIAERLKTKASVKSVFCVYYNGFADALSASSAAAIQDSPILYVKTNGELDSDTKQFISQNKSTIQNVYVIGGKGVISDSTLNKIQSTSGKTPKRLSGDNRYETCVVVNNQFASLFKSTSICAATGKAFPDALSGGVFAALNNSPVFLADQALNNAQQTYLKNKSFKTIYVLGGEGAVPNTMIQKIKESSV